jgi:hypothetical protein
VIEGSNYNRTLIGCRRGHGEKGLMRRLAVTPGVGVQGDVVDAERLRRRFERRCRARPQRHRWARGLGEVKVIDEVAEDRRVLADNGARVGRPSVFGLSRAPPRKSSSMNLRYASVVSVWLSIKPVLAYGADDQARHPDAVALGAYFGRHHIVVEAAPVVPDYQGARDNSLETTFDGAVQPSTPAVDRDLGVLVLEVRRPPVDHPGLCRLWMMSWWPLATA